MSEEQLQEVSVLVPTERVAQFYEMVGRWLAGPADKEAVVAGERPPVAAGKRPLWTSGDLDLAKEVWGHMNEWGRELFTVLMDNPEQRFSGQQLAEDLHLTYGKYGLAGVMAWPGRYCKAVGRRFALQWEAGPVGKSGNYWMTSEVAALFREARDSE